MHGVDLLTIIIIDPEKQGDHFKFTCVCRLSLLHTHTTYLLTCSMRVLIVTVTAYTLHCAPYYYKLSWIIILYIYSNHASWDKHWYLAAKTLLCYSQTGMFDLLGTVHVHT